MTENEFMQGDTIRFCYVIDVGEVTELKAFYIGQDKVLNRRKINFKINLIIINLDYYKIALCRMVLSEKIVKIKPSKNIKKTDAI